MRLAHLDNPDRFRPSAPSLRGRVGRVKAEVRQWAGRAVGPVKVVRRVRPVLPTYTAPTAARGALPLTETLAEMAAHDRAVAAAGAVTEPTQLSSVLVEALARVEGCLPALLPPTSEVLPRLAALDYPA